MNLSVSLTTDIPNLLCNSEVTPAKVSETSLQQMSPLSESFPLFKRPVMGSSQPLSLRNSPTSDRRPEAGRSNHTLRVDSPEESPIRLNYYYYCYYFFEKLPRCKAILILDKGMCFMTANMGFKLRLLT